MGCSSGHTTLQYTVTFDGDGATVEANPPSMTVTAPATTVGMLPTPPTKIGYDFGGWYTETKGAGTVFNIDTEVTANITVYAKWIPANCTPETDLAFCQRLGKDCESVKDFDNCGNSRSVVTCGTCTDPKTCGGGGEANVCGCIPETDLAFCLRLGKNCGFVTALDNCGNSRFVASCGTCTAPDACGDGGTPNLCGHLTSANIGNLVLVPSGTFQRDAGPNNTSEVSAFHMSQHEITQAQYMAVTSAFNPSWNVTPHVVANNTNRPVDYVTWYDVVEFCNQLSDKEGLTEAYTITNIVRDTQAPYKITSATVTMNAVYTGYRLPTEMEWMWAAMGATAGGATVGTTGYTKAFAGSTGSNAIGDYAWYDVNSYLSPNGPGTDNYGSHAVGTKLPNELDLYDMSGNVWEWCWDWYGDYPTGAVTDYKGAASGPARVKRGGSWVINASSATVANRDDYPPGYGNADMGFRVVRP